MIWDLGLWHDERRRTAKKHYLPVDVLRAAGRHACRHVEYHLASRRRVVWSRQPGATVARQTTQEAAVRLQLHLAAAAHNVIFFGNFFAKNRDLCVSRATKRRRRDRCCPLPASRAPRRSPRTAGCRRSSAGCSACLPGPPPRRSPPVCASRD